MRLALPNMKPITTVEGQLYADLIYAYRYKNSKQY